LTHDPGGCGAGGNEDHGGDLSGLTHPATVVADRAGVGAVTLAILGLATFPWFDHLLRQAGRPELTQLNASTIPTCWPFMIAATLGAVLASRRPTTR